MTEAFLPFSKPTIDAATIAEVVDSLESGWITTGPKVQRFEANLKAYLGAGQVLSINSATAGLHLALLAIGVKPGDEVITTPMTFAATANVVALIGAKPVFVDVEPTTFNIDVSKIEAAINERTKAIIPVHFAGLPVDLDPLYAIAKKHNLRVIEDCAHAIGTEYKGKKLGSFGDIQVFSFHPNKNMTTGEGGCISTSDEEVANEIALLRFHGMDREAWNRYGKGGKLHYAITKPGFKHNMMDIQAAIGLHQLVRLDEFIEKRTEQANRYLEAFKDWKSVELIKLPSYSIKHAWHIFTPLINPETSGVTRDEFMVKMKEHNIGTGLHYQALHLYPYYQNEYGYKQGDFPVAEKIGERIVSIPLFPTMTREEQDRVIVAMDKILNQ